MPLQHNDDSASVTQLPATDQLQQRSVTELLTSARRALEVGGSFEEVKKVRDQAEALRGYARSIGAARDAQNDIAEIKIRAERRLGEELARLDKNVGGRPRETADIGSGVSREPARPPTLKELGVTEKESSRWQTIASVPEDAFEEHVAQVKRAGDELTTASVYRLARRQQDAARRAEIAAQGVVLPEGKYSVIVMDPPWDMKKMEREVRPNQVGFDYPTMTEDRLKEFPVADLAHDDCHLFLWTTQRFVPTALRLIEHWGFKYSVQFVWLKNGGMQLPWRPQYNCEFAIYARRGNPLFIDGKAFPTGFEADDLLTGFKEDRRQHSRKPDFFYDLVRRVTVGPRIDVFSREQREGFEQHGNETQKFTASAAAVSLGAWLDQPAEDPAFRVSRIDVPRLMPPAATSVKPALTQNEEPEAPALPSSLGAASDAVTHGAA